MRWQLPAVDSPWPDHRLQLLLTASLKNGEEAQNALSRVETWLDPQCVDHETLVLLPLLHRNIVELRLSSRSAARYKSVHQWSWFRNVLLFDALRHVLASLDAAEIPALVLKGAALSSVAYRDMGARFMRDADVLVPIDRAREAAAVLQDAGFSSNVPLDDETLRSRHAAAYVRADGIEIDLHWQQLAEKAGAGVDGALWRHAVPFDLRGFSARTLAAEDHLIQAIAHGFQTTIDARRVHWVPDAFTLIARTTVDWDRLLERASGLRITPLLRETLRHLRTVYGAPIPDAVLHRASALRVSRGERIESWFRQRGVTGTPLGIAAQHWFQWTRICRNNGRKRTPLGFLNFVSRERSVRGSTMAKLCGMWAVRQILWFTVGTGRRILRREPTTVPRTRA